MSFPSGAPEFVFRLHPFEGGKLAAGFSLLSEHPPDETPSHPLFLSVCDLAERLVVLRTYGYRGVKEQDLNHAQAGRDSLL